MRNIKILIGVLSLMIILATGVMAVDYTDDLCENGTVTASETNAGRPPERAFDDANTGFKVDAWLNIAGVTDWIKYDFGSGNTFAIAKYTVANTNRVDSVPTAWTFECSTDNTNWDVLDTQSGLSWNSLEQKDFTFSNSNAYRYCMLDITASASGSYIEVGEIEMMEEIITTLEISTPQPTNNSQLAKGTDNTILGVTTNNNADCKYSTSSGQSFTSMTAFTTTGSTTHSSTITDLQNGINYDYYIKCNDTATGDISTDYQISFNLSNLGATSINFDTAGDWTQENATDGTEFDSGKVKLQESPTGGTTSDVCNGGTATTKLVHTRVPARAFDNANTNFLNDAWFSNVMPTWLKYDFGSGNSETIVKYTLASSSRNNYAPRTWTFICSNDDTNWDILDTQSGMSAWSTFDQKDFTFSNSVAYRYCMLNLTATKSFDNNAEIGEMQMMAALMGYPISQTYYVYSNNAQIDTSLWGGINSITVNQTTPASTSLKYLISFDGRTTWKYWTGSAWAASSLADLQTNGIDKSTLEAITRTQWSASGGFEDGTLDFAMDLQTSDSANTPEISGIDISYTEKANCIDKDGDGWGASGSNLSSCNFTSDYECDDNNASINPNAYDIPNNGIDEDCSGADATASYEAKIYFSGETGYSGLGYFIGDDIGYEVDFKKNNISSDEDITNIVVNLTDVWGTVLKSQTVSSMDHPNTGNWTGTFTTDDISVQDDDKVNLKVYVYGSGGVFLAGRTHGDEWFATGTAPAVTSSNFDYVTVASSNYTVRDLAANSSFGLINWSGSTLDLSEREIDLDSAITMADKLVVIDSASYSELNASATLSFENVDCSSPYVYYSETETTRINILAEDNLCTAPRCTNIQCSDDVLTVTVDSFSGYAAEGNANMTIDAGDPKAIGEDVTFTSEYLNTTSGSLITGADCEIFFTDGNYMMAEEATEYTYNRTFSSSGIKEYNVTCNLSGYNTLTAYDNATITTGVGAVPEFSTITLGIGLIVVLAGLVLIRRKE